MPRRRLVMAVGSWVAHYSFGKDHQQRSWTYSPSLCC